MTRRTATATPFVHEGPRRTATATSFCPRRTRRTATATSKPFIHEGPRRAAKDHEEGQGQHLFVREGTRRGAKNCNCNGKTFNHGGHGGPRRTATATSFCPRRAAKGHEGPRRRSRATPFCPRRDAKGREELQLQNLYPRRTRRATENGNCNTFYPRRATKGREELQLQHLLCTKVTEGGGGTGVETGAGAVRPGFGGGRCGGAAPAQGRALAADRPELQWSVISG